jgi:hypothetical protein
MQMGERSQEGSKGGIQASAKTSPTWQRRQRQVENEEKSEAMDEDRPTPKPKEANTSNPFGKKSVGACHTFLGTPTVRAMKSAVRTMNATVLAAPQYIK